MTVEEKRASEPVQQQRELRLNRLVIGTMDLDKPFLQLIGADRPSPQIAVLLRSCRDDSEASPCPSTDSAAAGAINDRGIDLVFGAIAVDCRPGRPCDDGAAAALQRPPDEAVDKRILKRCQGRLATGGKRHQPVRIIAT